MIAAAPALAATQIVSLGTRTQNGAASSTFTFAGFDGSLGALQSVSFDVSGSSVFNIKLSNSTGPNATYTAKNTTFFYINGLNFQPAISEAGSGTALVDSGGNFVASTAGSGAAGTITNAAALSFFTTNTLSGYFLVDPPFQQLTVLQNGQPSSANAVTVASAVNSGTVTYTYLDRNNGVPEPATWAMFIGGFGLVGGAMRRRRGMVARFT